MLVLRIGCVPFINALPLIEGLANEMVFDDPAILTRKMLHEELDIALLPVVDLLRYPRFEPFTQLVISSLGEIKSIRLVSNVPILEVRSYRRDYQSRSSNSLVNILFQNYWKIPTIETADSADATLYIGDRALLTPRGSYDYDLGKIWSDWTGLPFVYATSLKRAGINVEDWEEKLNAAYQRGKAILPSIARVAGSRLGIGADLALDYFSRCVAYEATPQCDAGIQRFYQEVSTIETLPVSNGQWFFAAEANVHR